jgi:hypothetical protein
MLVGPTTFTAVQAVPPNLTTAPAKNSVPVIVIDVPPANAPPDEEIPEMVGAKRYMNPVAKVSVKVFVLVTVIAVNPEIKVKGVTHVMVVSFTTTGEVQTFNPISTVAPV